MFIAEGKSWMRNLKQKVIRGGFAKVCAQGATFALRMGSLMVLARLLDPKDFGLVGMVTAFTGVLNLFRDFGLSTATVQRDHVTDDQVSTLFWINIFVGVVLAFILIGLAPFVAIFYHEPRLVWVSVILATSFIFNGAGVQHTALLERQVRFTALAAIDIISLVLSMGIGIGMAASGLGYWALVASAVTYPLISTFCLWFTTDWRPGKVHFQKEVHSMLRFGGAFTLISVIVYTVYNLEKVLVGRYWGAAALGLYSRGYQLINLPTENLTFAFGGLAFSGLSRVRDEPERFRSYFLKGYSLILALTIPMTIAAALFAPTLIPVVLGAKWNDVADIVRFLGPTILVYSLINPLAWMSLSLGMIGRNLKIVSVLAPLVICGYVLGLPYGPRGVAIGYSAVMTLWTVPHIAWCVHGTVISLRDIFAAAARPFVSSIVAAVLAYGVQFRFGQSLAPLPSLILGVTVFASVYAGVLFYVMGQKAVYRSLFQGLRRNSTVEEETLVTA